MEFTTVELSNDGLCIDGVKFSSIAIYQLNM